ncbi:MAG TPA: sugar transferase, partial [Micromonosporaceae bacterium]|nr:sugar transferase [Micromonosporaceae bacterium]
MTTAGFSTAAHGLGETGVTRPISDTADIGLTYPASLVRSAWESRYVNTLMLIDILVGITAAFVALQVKFGSPEIGVSYRTYAVLTIVVPIAWIIGLGLNHAYDTRFLFVGNDEYQRVLRSGLALTAAIAIGSYAFDITVARGYVVIAMPIAVTLGVITRYLQRKRLHHAWAQHRCLRRALLVGHPGAVESMARQLRRETYH